MKLRLNFIITAVTALAVLCFAAMFAGAQAGQGGRATEDARMKGPAPKLANGKPSMAGLWGQVRRADVTNPAIPGFVKELPYTEWGKKQWDQYPNEEVINGDYAGSCMPFGLSRTVYGPHPIQIMQDNEFLAFLAEQNTWFHLVPTDGRKRDPELPPSWFGDSLGHWEGDTLVIETTNMNGYIKVDTIGHPLSNQAKIIQTFKRIDFGHAEHTFTVDDPKTYTRPWTITETWTLRLNDRIMEYSCEENNRDLFDGHIKPWRPPVLDDEEKQ